jgi:hypothetical protein
MRKRIVATLVCILLMIISMTFTPTGVADWAPGDGHKMHWPQTPDLTETGVAVEMPLMQIRADDFECSETGYITGIHIWGSFEKDEVPLVGINGLIFYLSIWENIPAAPGTPYYFSQPGQMQWTMSFNPGTYTVHQVANDTNEGWYEPTTNIYNANDHNDVYLYNFEIPAPQAFLQEEGIVYWLGVKLYFTSVGQDFGWKTTDTTLQWNDNAVWYSGTGWLPLNYPAGHDYEGDPLDFAFVINGEPLPPTVTFVPYPFTPTTLNLASNGRWVKVKIELPEGYEAEDIVMDTVMLADSVPVDWGKMPPEPLGKQSLMLKFDRGDLEDLLIPSGPPTKPAEFKISGRLMDGTPFEAYSEPVTLILPGK